ncbi:unnamed protein product [Paramecium sonneborni]|uniref:Uncharacterized protein n=1 Tax=Paramecium sonneborni TaxID=65129 RepID=A0A8S1RR63_9CILI|nr:unnamed protein product [Paramecium sonneborni]
MLRILIPQIFNTIVQSIQLKLSHSDLIGNLQNNLKNNFENPFVYLNILYEATKDFKNQTMMEIFGNVVLILISLFLIQLPVFNSIVTILAIIAELSFIWSQSDESLLSKCGKTVWTVAQLGIGILPGSQLLKLIFHFISDIAKKLGIVETSDKIYIGCLTTAGAIGGGFLGKFIGGTVSLTQYGTVMKVVGTILTFASSPVVIGTVVGALFMASLYIGIKFYQKWK